MRLGLNLTSIIPTVAIGEGAAGAKAEGAADAALVAPDGAYTDAAAAKAVEATAEAGKLERKHTIP